MAPIATAVLVTITEDGHVEHTGIPPAVAASVIADERLRREALEPAITRRLDVTSRAGGPLTITPEAAAAMAEEGLVTVSREDLRAVLRNGRFSSTDLIAAADRLAFVARYTAEDVAEATP